MRGKILGAMLGLCAGLLGESGIAAIVLAIIGAAAGHLVDAHFRDPDELLPPDGEKSGPDFSSVREAKLDPEPHRASETPAADQKSSANEQSSASLRTASSADRNLPLREELCRLFAHIAAADGEVAAEEVRVIKAYFAEEPRFRADGLELVRVALKSALQFDSAAPPEATQASAVLTAAEKLGLMDAFFELGLSDGKLQRSERDAIRRAATAVGIGPEDFQRVAELHFGDGADHFGMLGLHPGATNEEVKRAFRQLAAAEHPDRAASGQSEHAAEKFRAIKDAYDRIRELRGF